MSVNNFKQILVYVKGVNNKVAPASFKHCLFEQLGIIESEKCEVSCVLLNNKLILETKTFQKCSPNESIKSSERLYSLCHPSFCPVLNMSKSDFDSIPNEISSRGVNVGVVLLLEPSDDCILLTRRAFHMRTFPGVWVPPGGHIEWDETLEEAGLRELFEETGLKFSFDETKMKILGLWESVYPSFLGMGLPHRHHVVVYIHCQIKKSSHDLETELKLNPEEVDASMWLPERIVQSIIFESKIPAEEKLEFTTVDLKGEHSSGIMDSSIFEDKFPPPGAERERLTTGTRYALELWLEEKRKIRTLTTNTISSQL